MLDENLGQLKWHEVTIQHNTKACRGLKQEAEERWSEGRLNNKDVMNSAKVAAKLNHAKALL